MSSPRGWQCAQSGHSASPDVAPCFLRSCYELAVIALVVKLQLWQGIVRSHCPRT